MTQMKSEVVSMSNELSKKSSLSIYKKKYVQSGIGCIFGVFTVYSVSLLLLTYLNIEQ
jgi:hypothetical protein